MIVVIYGEDELGKMRRVRQLREEADGGTGMIESNLKVMNGRDARANDLVMQAMAVPFLAPKRMIVVEDFLKRFDSRRGERGDDADPGESRAMKQFQPLIDALPHVPPSTVLVFTGTAGTKNHPFIKAVERAGGTSESFAALKGAELSRFVREEAAIHGVRFKNGPSRRPLAPEDEWRRPSETDPAILLANLHQPQNEQGRQQPDTLSISNELQKLSLYAMGRDVTVDDVDEVCAGQRDFQRWSFQDWVMDGQLALALNALDFFVRGNQNLQGILGILMSGYRQMATILDLLDDRASEATIGAAINRKFGTNNYIRRARNLGRPGLKAAYEAMVSADRATKSGETPEEIAMSILITRLCEIANQKPGLTRQAQSR